MAKMNLRKGMKIKETKIEYIPKTAKNPKNKILRKQVTYHEVLATKPTYWLIRTLTGTHMGMEFHFPRKQEDVHIIRSANLIGYNTQYKWEVTEDEVTA